ncbi:MAG: pantoate--beta-alanine ligase [Rikenellaceae bacterium]
MFVVNGVATLAAELNNLRTKGSVGFVPTMGALHQGHMELVRRAREQNDVVVVSIFVNPTQFNDPNDLESYPRTLEADCAMLEQEGVDIVFAPSVKEVYPEPDERIFDLGGVDQGMEGAHRPGHFNGVAQVVYRLFEMVQPTRSYFGEKDFQQVAVIRELLKSMTLQMEIVTVPIVREDTGLAMSSRNRLLEAQYLEVAPLIYGAMSEATSMVEQMSVEQVQRWVVNRINQTGLLEVVYFEIVDALTMSPIVEWGDADIAQGCIAVQAGSVRLIDNVRFK